MRFPGSQVSKYKTISATILNICCKSFTANYQLFYGSLMNFLGKERQGRTTFDLQWDDRAHAGREIWKMFLWSEEQEKKIQKTNCEEELSRYSCLQTASLEDYWKINISCSPNKNGRIGVYFHWKITFLTDPEWGGWSIQFCCNILMSVNVPFQNQRHEQRHFQGVFGQKAPAEYLAHGAESSSTPHWQKFSFTFPIGFAGICGKIQRKGYYIPSWCKPA